MPIAQLLNEETDRIASEFEAFARTRLPAAKPLSSEELQDSIRQLLSAIQADLASSMSDHERAEKAQGRRRENSPDLTEYAHRHAATRLQQGFTLNQAMEEYRALRASIHRVVQEHKSEATVDDIVRLQEALDQVIVEGVCWYGGQIERGRQLFLSIFGHDLRNPISAASMCAEALLLDERLSSESTVAAVRIRNSVVRMSRMIEDLLDFTRTGLGTRLPTARARMDLCAVVAKTIDELRAAHPTRDIRLDAPPELWGDWDSERLAQMMSNLIGNAVQHGDPLSPVSVSLRADPDQVVRITVHNHGPAIAPEFRQKIFDPLVRGVVLEAEFRNSKPSVGLGLYISREIAKAHGGSIDVESSEDQGTTFMVKLPQIF